MLSVRRANTRGRFQNDWLDASFSFSFGAYQHPDRMNWGPLRAINDDIVQPGKGFAPHAHADIETLTYPLYGMIEHRDSLGNRHRYGRGTVQRMSAGTGIEHSEMNPSDSEPERHLQIWLMPHAQGGMPECELCHIPDDEKRNRWRIIAAPDGRDGSARIRQQASIYACLLGPGISLSAELARSGLGYLHVVSGNVCVNGSLTATEGDGIGLTQEDAIHLSANEWTEALLFDMA